MARTDDFQQARDLAAEELAKQEISEISRRSGFESDGENHLRAPFLDRCYRISYPEFTFSDTSDASAEVPLQEQVLLLHYLLGCQPRLTGEWVAYREIPGAGFYYGAFVKRAIDPLKKVFGQNVDGLRRAAAKLNATPLETGQAAFQLNVLPYAPIQIILWEGDEEFPAEANVLFDSTVGNYLSPEDAAWLGSLPVYRMMALGH